MKTLQTQIQEALKGLKFEMAQTRKGSEYKIYDVTEADDFWTLWKQDKESIKALGYVAFKKDRYSERYYLRDMSSLEYDCSKKASKTRSLENLEKARAVKAANDEARKALKKPAKKVAQKKPAKASDSLSPSELIRLADAVKTLQSLGFDVTSLSM